MVNVCCIIRKKVFEKVMSLTMVIRKIHDYEPYSIQVTAIKPLTLVKAIKIPEICLQGDGGIP